MTTTIKVSPNDLLSQEQISQFKYIYFISNEGSTHKYPMNILKADIFVHILKIVKSDYLNDRFKLTLPFDQDVLVCEPNINDNEMKSFFDLVDPCVAIKEHVDFIIKLNMFNSPKEWYQSKINSIFNIIESFSVTRNVVDKFVVRKWDNHCYPDRDYSDDEFTTDDNENNGKTSKFRFSHYLTNKEIDIYEPLVIANVSIIEELFSLIMFLRENQPDLLTDYINKLITYPNVCAILHQFEYIHGPVSININDLKTSLRYLFQEEQRQVLSTNINIDHDNLFIFNVDNAFKLYPQGIRKPVESWYLLDYYLGGFLFDLDLSHSYITGSCFCATFLRYPFHPDISGVDVIDLYYPTYYHEGNVNKFRDIYNLRKSKDLWSDLGREISKSHKVSKEEVIKHFEIKTLPGSDIDIAVDDTLSEDDFYHTVINHFKVVKRYYPQATLTKQERKNSAMWVITGAHREIQIYQSSIRHIMTHHVGMVRGYVTGNDHRRQAYLSASCLLSAIEKYSINYYYFAGKKSKCEEVIMKYYRRGWKLPPNLDREFYIAITNYFDKRTGHFSGLSRKPFVNGLSNLDVGEIHFRHFKILRLD